MSSFLFQKEQINCTCFDNSPKANRRVFRSQSYHPTSSNNKTSKQMPSRPESEQGKYKKKSLKKEKPLSCAGSQRDIKQKEQSNNTIFVPQIPIGFSNHLNKKEQKIINFDYIEHQKIPILKTQRNKPSHPVRTNRVNYPSNWQPVPIYTHYPSSNTQITVPSYSNKEINILPRNDYEQMINRQFQNDLYEFKIHMQNKQKQEKQIQESLKVINQTKQKEKHENRLKIKSRKQSLTLNKAEFDKIQSQIRFKDQSSRRMSISNQIEHKKEMTGGKQQSFRNSTVSQKDFKQKQSISKKIKNKMFPKQIQSQKDGNQTDSDKMSEVVGRGWDGLTEQKIEMQQLDSMIKNGKFNSETMVTQQSHIKNSEIKTLTEYSNSLISPKSQYNKAMMFGGGHKYGVTGMSYQHIDEFGKNKNHIHDKFNF